MLYPNVPGAWYPTNKIVFLGFHKLCFKWCFILPTSHIPLADMIIAGVFLSFNAFDSSEVIANLSPGNSSGLSPCEIACFVSSSNNSILFLKTSVADIASGLSTYTSDFINVLYLLINSSSFLVSFILFSSYNISCVLPTAKDGIITFPPFSMVSDTIFKNNSAFSSFLIWILLPYVDSITKKSVESIIVGESNNGISLFPKSPVNTVFVSFSPSFAQISIILEPNICPASLNLTWISGVISITLSYETGLNNSKECAASSAVYSGGNGFSPFLSLFLFFHSISISCICPLSGNIKLHKSQVALCAYIGFLYPSLYNFGILPEWSIWACVSKTKSISWTLKSNGASFSYSCSALPWNIPQSTRNFFPAASTK